VWRRDTNYDLGSLKIEDFWLKAIPFTTRIYPLSKELKSKATHIIKSPLPLFTKEGILPPFGKGRLGGIFQTMSSYL
jgi:hypothetical protein